MQPKKGAGLIAEEDGTRNIFMASSSIESQSNLGWLIDSGCSNHMTGDKTLFNSLDESMEVNVRLGDNKEM